MKTLSFCYLAGFIILLASCQKINTFETSETKNDDGCFDKYERQNNVLNNTPTLDLNQQSDWIALPKNDNDYWHITVKANAKGALPSKIVYKLSHISTIEISVFSENELVARPQTTMSFRQNTEESIAFDGVNIGESIVVHIKHRSGEATCYALRFE